MSEQVPAGAPYESNVPPAPPDEYIEPEGKTSGLAIASLVLGILGLLTCGVTALVGLILGIVGLVSIKGSEGRLKGAGLATGGIVVSAVFLLAVPFMSIMAGMLLPALGRARDEARKVRCSSNLRQIGTAANIWLTKFGDNEKWPPSLKALYDDGIIVDPRAFLCPGKGQEPASAAGEFETDYECILGRAGYTLTEAVAGSDVPLAWDKPDNHSDGFNVVYFDSHVEFHDDDNLGSQRREFLESVDAWIKEHQPDQ